MNFLALRFLRASVTLERRVSTDAYAGNGYATGVTVQARWFDDHQVLRTSDAREVTSSAHVTTRELVSNGDRITDPHGRAREVIHVRRNEDTRGRFSHYVAYLA